MSRLNYMKSFVICMFMTWALSVSGSEVSYQDVRDWLQTDAAAPVDGIAPGVYGVRDLAKLRHYLPPGFAEEFDFSELSVEITETEHYLPHKSYRAATERFEGTASIGPDGAIESYTAGRPFSAAAIDAAPPEKAGYMVAWSHIFRWQHYGYETDILMSYVEPNPSGDRHTAGMEGGGNVIRSMTLYYRRVYLNKLAHQPDGDYRLDIDNTDELHWKEYIEFLDPFDVAGSKFVVERSLDPNLGDQMYSYLPNERRVRRLSAEERSDSFMGSDLTFDDLQGFSGRVLDYSWKYLGRKVVMHVSASRHEQAVFFGPHSHVPSDRWQLRPCYVVELIPKWEGHPYGRRVQFIDADSFNTVVSLIFDRGDSLWKIVYTAYEHADVPAGTEPNAEESVHRWSALVAIDLHNNTTTVSREPPGTQSRYEAVSPSRVRRLFDVSNLTGGR